MMSLAGKKIVLGVSGGIAAYKTPELVRPYRVGEMGRPGDSCPRDRRPDRPCSIGYG